MKLFSWLQNKLSGKPHLHPCHRNQVVNSGNQKEEFSDWPNGILSIGTLFNKSLKDDICPASSQEQAYDFTSEEIDQLQKELNALISSTDLDYLSCFEAGNNNDKEKNDDQHYTIIPNKAKEVYLDNNNMSNNAISKKSLSFLLKKMFICGAGFGPTFSLRDPILSPPKTRMSKILRALLRTKIYPQSPCQSMTRKQCLEIRRTEINNFDDDEFDEKFYLEGTDSSKWVKTDTEYIVLEI